jgi:hypothetical protein
LEKTEVTLATTPTFQEEEVGQGLCATGKKIHYVAVYVLGVLDNFKVYGLLVVVKGTP